MSSLLDSPEAQKIKASGGMVGDEEVLRLLLRELLKPQYRDSGVLDGFPRTKVQVECLKMLYDQMIHLRREFLNTPEAHKFKQPTFHIMVLFVDEAESIARQLKRGRETLAHNAEVRESGVGELWEERNTDFDEKLARNRYRTFKEQTYDALRHIPLAEGIVKGARQELVNRLDGYEVQHPELLKSVVDFIQTKMMPVIKRYAVSGRAMFNSEDELFEDPVALAILIDIFSERGFRAIVDIHH